MRLYKFDCRLSVIKYRDKIMKKDARYYIEKLGLEKHIEGGYFRQYIVGDEKVELERDKDRNIYTSIFFLIEKDNISHLHKLQVDEVWYYHDGNPLTIYMLSPDGILEKKKLGLDIDRGEMPQILVPAGYYFGAAMEEEEFSLVGCMCSPGFIYEEFELMHMETLEKEYPQYKDELKKMIIKE